MILFRRKKGDSKGDEVKEDEEVRSQPRSQPKHQSYAEVNLEGLIAMLDKLGMEGDDDGSKSRDNAYAYAGVREAAKIASRFNQHIDSLKGVSEGLKRRAIRGELTPQLKGIVERARDTVVSVIVEVSKPLPEPKGMSDITLIQDKARRVLNRIGDVSGSHRRILYEFFPAEARALKDILMAMKSDVDALDGIARSLDEHVSSYSKCRDRIARLVQMEQEMKTFYAKMKEMRDSFATLEQERAEVERMREVILNTNEYIEVDRMLSNVRMEYDRLLAEIARDFSRLSKAISKYEYEVGFEKDEYAILKAVIDEPSRLKDVEADVIRDMLGRLSDIIASGRLYLKNPEKDIENVHTLIDRLEHYIGKCREYEGMLKIYMERITPYQDRLKVIDADLERIKREMDRVRGMLEEYAKRASSLKSAMDEEIKQLTSDIYRIYGLNVRIRLDYLD